MTTATETPLAELYLEDETAWLDAMSELARRRDAANIDWDHLGEYLTDMASRDRREVMNRLVVLLAHLLKWEHQPDKRSGGWRATVREQSRRLSALAGSGVLRNHVEEVLAEAYSLAVEYAMDETGLPESAFPESCPYDLDFLFAVVLPD